jgi:RND family efflux transporter MFP subunit
MWALARNRPNVTALPSNAPKSAPSGAEVDPRSPEVESERWLGVVLAHEAIDITPRQEGKIRALHVRLGDHVAENGIIANLDTTNIGFDLTMAEAAIKAAEAERNKAAVELREASERHERRKALAAEAVASLEDLATAGYQKELAQARLDVATAQVGEKRARAAQLRQLRADADLRAPFEGIVAARYVDAGANVTATTRIVRLISSKPPFVRFAVPEKSRLKLGKGTRVRVEIEGEQQPARATIATIAPEIDSASRMIIVEATLDRPDEMGFGPQGAITRVMLEDRP